MYKEQEHLTFNNTINLGSFYTPQHIVNIVFDMLNKHINNIENYFIVDTSCGYGSFLQLNKTIGADIDADALKVAQKNNPNAKYYCHNSLSNIDRMSYGLTEQDKIIIVGNPPYNDKTSIIRNEIKHIDFKIDNDLKARDLGISFILSYQKLKADYVCVLHPLSYLLKKTNFDNLRSFKYNYILKDALVISSGEFSKTSKTTQFPIVIALYEKNDWGMKYDFICNWNFRTIEKKQFKINQFDYIVNYITKYPNKQNVLLEDTIAYFWTMRDINALKRTKTFIEKENTHTIRITKDKFPYYCYIDVFKNYIKHIPYYFGNSDVFIAHNYFMDMQDLFVKQSCSKYSFIRNNNSDISGNDLNRIDIYFRDLLGEHYVD